MTRFRPLLLHVLLPLLAGGLLYLLFRAPSLRLFEWFRVIGLEPCILAARASLESLGMRPPSWVLYTLPDGLWVYTATACMAWIWQGSRGAARWGWMAAGPGLGLGSELGQLVGLMPGTFDPLDLIACGVAAVLAFALTQTPKESLA